MTTMLTLLLAAALLWLARRPLLRAVGGFLIANAGEAAGGDLIILLNGGLSTRPFLAARLCRTGPPGAPELTESPELTEPRPIVLARLADTQEVRMGVIPNISESTRDLLIKSGVPAARVHLLTSDRWIAGTWYEAILICAFMRANGYRRGLIVTDAFHTRRARWAFRKVMGDDRVSFECAATPFSLNMAGRWWCSEYAVIQEFQEYIKFLYYQWRWQWRGRSAGQRPREADLLLADEVRPLVCGAAKPDVAGN